MGCKNGLSFYSPNFVYFIDLIILLSFIAACVTSNKRRIKTPIFKEKSLLKTEQGFLYV